MRSGVWTGAVLAATAAVVQGQKLCLMSTFVGCGAECRTTGKDGAKDYAKLDLECIRDCVDNLDNVDDECLAEVDELLDALDECQAVAEEVCPDNCAALEEDEQKDCKKELKKCLKDSDEVDETCDIEFPKLKKGKALAVGRGAKGGNICFVLAHKECREECLLDEVSEIQLFNGKPTLRFATGFDLDCVKECVESSEDLGKPCQDEVLEAIEVVNECDDEVQKECPDDCEGIEDEDEQEECRDQVRACLDDTETVGTACENLQISTRSGLSSSGGSGAVIGAVAALAVVGVVAGVVVTKKRRGTDMPSAQVVAAESA
eukprot:CAMPEP_0184524700 /NCGR_PEP_ID=MMETSP0198_2-20121128/9672_1 /TAXON_ID=1112570 /ORGANISM="Thraustochytrium sp., Strain LLF1b" /LENGTH=317 /DNA_ID=CAMNT_0026916045 /DNA_START=48 /DNA_END=1001 /DNA_ORIENTATION=-